MQKANIQILNKVVPVIRKQPGSHRIKIQASDFNIQDIIKGKIKAVVNHKYCYSFQERKKGAHAGMFS